MDEDYSPSNWAFYYQDEGINELKHTLLYTTLELENTLVAAHEELARKNDELVHLKTLLTKTIKEKEEAHSKCQSQIHENFLLQQKLQHKKMHTTQAIVCPDEPSPQGDSVTRCSSSDCDENVTASSPPQLDVAYHQLVTNKTLPENGKFLQAVMEAGPLLQTLLVAGPLPQWQHPPPQLNIIEIPPVTIQSPRNILLGQDSCFSKKRGGLIHTEDFGLSPNGKNQKVVHL